MRTHVARVLRVLIPTTFALAIAVGVGVATGAIPDGGGVIHGCYQPDDGQLRVIDPAQGTTCEQGETALAWNQKGPKGDPGPAGPAFGASAYNLFPGGTKPASDGHVAKFTFNAPAAGFASITAQWVILARNTSGDCSIESQLAAAPAAPDPYKPADSLEFLPAALPTQTGDGPYLHLPGSTSLIVPVVQGANTVYLNGSSNCNDYDWSRVTIAAVYLNSTDTSATVTK